MPFIRINNLKFLPPEHGLKEVQPCPTFKEALNIGRDSGRIIYYFKRAGFPPLLMEKMARILEHEYTEGKCIHCGRAEPKPEDQPTATTLEKQGNSSVTLPDPGKHADILIIDDLHEVEPLPAPPIDSRLAEAADEARQVLNNAGQLPLF